MIPYEDHLLPMSETPLNKALSAVGVRLEGINAPTREVWNPWTCPPQFLEVLAHAFSVDLWLDSWPEDRKRRVIANAIRLHRIKGTERGLRDHVAYMDGEVRQILVPPQRIFASRTLTKAEMDAWLLTMPQIRVYLAKEVGSAKGLSFVSHDFFGHAFARFDAGRALYGRAARLWDSGEEIPVRTVDLRTERRQSVARITERVSLPGQAGAALFVGCYWGHGYVGVNAVTKPARIVTYTLDHSYEYEVSTLALNTVDTGLEPVDVRSERVSANGEDRRGAFPGRFVGHCYYRPDRGEWLLYDRVILHDPARAAPKVRAWSFYNHSHIGIQPFTAKVVIDAKTTAPRGALFASHGFIGRQFARAEDSSKRDAINLAARVSKAARDRILVTNKLTRHRTFADGLPLDGSVTFGDRVPFRL